MKHNDQVTACEKCLRIEADCLPSDAVIWVNGLSLPQCLEDIKVGQEVLCYDRESHSLKYVPVRDVGRTAKAEDVDWIDVTLENGTILVVTADHPVCCCNHVKSLVSCKHARDLSTISDSVIVLKTTPTQARLVSVSRSHTTPNGFAWKLNVAEPDKHLVFVTGSRRGSSNLPIAVGSSNSFAQNARKINLELQMGVDSSGAVSFTTVGDRNEGSGGFSDELTRHYCHNDNGRNAHELTRHWPNDTDSIAGHLSILECYDFEPVQSDLHNAMCTQEHTDAHNLNMLINAFDRTGSNAQRLVRHRPNKYFVAEHLYKLDHVDPRRVVVVRKISPLGYEAGEVLRAYFSQFGIVQDVMLCGSKEEAEDAQVLRGRQRPSRFGFVVMSTMEEVARVLARDEVHEVQGVAVLVRQFLPRAFKSEGVACSSCHDAEGLEGPPGVGRNS